MPETNKHIACCGLDCAKCMVYIATQENDDEKRRETAILWNKNLNLNLMPEEINCNGCLIDGCLTERVGGDHTCPIRKCVREKEFINCAYCGDYICGTLEQYFKMFPETASYCRETLNGIRREIKSS